jgi:hypothetical protein
LAHCIDNAGTIARLELKTPQKNTLKTRCNGVIEYRSNRANAVFNVAAGSDIKDA